MCVYAITHTFPRLKTARHTSVDLPTRAPWVRRARIREFHILMYIILCFIAVSRRGVNLTVEKAVIASDRSITRALASQMRFVKGTRALVHSVRGDVGHRAAKRNNPLPDTLYIFLYTLDALVFRSSPFSAFLKFVTTVAAAPPPFHRGNNFITN